MSDIPKTSETYKAQQSQWLVPSYTKVVMAEFCWEMERQLDEARKQVEDLKRERDSWKTKCIDWMDMEPQRDSLQQAVNDLLQVAETAINTVECDSIDANRNKLPWYSQATKAVLKHKWLRTAISEAARKDKV